MMHWLTNALSNLQLRLCGVLTLGRGSHFGGRVCMASPAARVRIGERTNLPDTRIHCALPVVIGNDVLVGAGCTLRDHDGHSTVAAQRRGDMARAGQEPDWRYVRRAQIRIEDGVWMGEGVHVLKGVTVGRGATIGAGSVVTHDVPTGEVWAGNPARKISSAVAARSAQPRTT
jgi:acetyltransferase-like isoleucine patch superfamily enzyme